VSDIIFFLLAGMGLGSLYAMLGAGLVIVYRGSGVINFAQGAFAMYGVFTFDEARRNGYLRLPWFDFLPTYTLNVPVDIKLSDEGVSSPVAFVLAVLMAVLIGLMAHFLVFRPLRSAAPLGKVIGSLGVMLYLQGVAQKNFGGTGRQPEAITPDGVFDNFLGLGKAYPQGTFYAVLFAVVMGLILWGVFQFTRFGLATRAASSNEKGAVLLGYSPQLLAALNWVIASVLATVAAIVLGPTGGSLTPVGLSALVVASLGAALIGRLQSILITVAGGLALGAVQSLLVFWSSDDWFPNFLRSGARDVVPFIVIGVVLFLRGKSLPVRGTVEEKRLPLAPYPVRIKQHMVVWSALVIVSAVLFEGAGARAVFSLALVTSMIASILMLSMVVITGYVGQISLAQLSFAGVSAFVMARMMADGSTTISNPFPVSGPGLPWPIAALIGVITAIIVGVIVGLPAVRIRGVQLAVVTVAFAISLQSLYFDNPALTGLSAGAPASVKPASLFGIDLKSIGDKGLKDRPEFVIFVLVVLLGCVALVANLRRNGTGRRFLAVRANERAAAAAGINVSRQKLLAFGIAAGIAGIGGVMLGFNQGDVSSAGFVYQASLAYLAFAYLGGITSINGAVVGGLLAPAGFITVLSGYFLRDANIQDYTTIIGGIGMIVTAIQNPNGIAPTLQPLFQHLGRWLRSARGPEWATAGKHLGPTFIVGVVLGYLVWPLRVESYNSFWMPLLGGLLALFVRGIYKQARAGSHAPVPHGNTPTPATAGAAPTPVEVG
jgi:ABC-type branched-subunit amino acid transport system permease subunit